MVLDTLTIENEMILPIKSVGMYKEIAVIRSIISSENGKFNLHTYIHK